MSGQEEWGRRDDSGYEQKVEMMDKVRDSSMMKSTSTGQTNMFKKTFWKRGY